MPNLYPVELHGYVELGKAFENSWAVAKGQVELHHKVMGFDNMLYGSWETWMVYRGMTSSPFKDIYGIGYRISYDNIYLQYEHFCNHPVFSSYNAEWWVNNRRSGNALTTISVGVRW
jgi:hypothetical protein